MKKNNSENLAVRSRKPAPSRSKQDEDLHFARSSYNYDDNYSDYANSEGYRAYQDFSESGLRTDEDAPRRTNFGGDDNFEHIRDESYQRARGIDYESKNNLHYGSDNYQNQESVNYAYSHSGKGPKGYQRSDERVREDVCEVLSQHPGIDASEIEVSVKEGIVSLTGTVESRQIKRLAEEIIDRTSGVKDINNNLRIDTTLASRGHTFAANPIKR